MGDTQICVYKMYGIQYIVLLFGNSVNDERGKMSTLLVLNFITGSRISTIERFRSCYWCFGLVDCRLIDKVEVINDRCSQDTQGSTTMDMEISNFYLIAN